MEAFLYLVVGSWPGATLARDRISLRNMAFFAYHGVAPTEKLQGQRFFVDADLFLDLSRAGTHDDIHSTVDYEGVFGVVKDHVEGKRFHIIEALADTVARSLLAEFPVESVTIRVRKPSVPLQGILDYTEVEITRDR
jgi:dihydroneopterin aldolase